MLLFWDALFLLLRGAHCANIIMIIKRERKHNADSSDCWQGRPKIFTHFPLYEWKMAKLLQCCFCCYRTRDVQKQFHHRI